MCYISDVPLLGVNPPYKTMFELEHDEAFPDATQFKQSHEM